MRRIRESVAALQPKTPSARVVRDAERSASRGAPTPLGDRSRLGRKLATGEWITAVQTRPPRGWDPSALVQDCRQLANAGVDLVSLYEDRRTSRLGVMAAARLVLQRCAIEPVVHYTCQSRTMFDMISDLLGAAAGDVRNLLLVSGDPPLGGPYREFASVIDIDSIGLTNVVTGLNAGVDASGNDIGDPTEFVIGVALNQGARDPVREAERLFWKADAGAHYAVTQPVFDAEQLFDFLERQPGLRLPIIAGIWPLQSLRQAEFLQNEVPGVFVPDHVVERMREAEDRGPEAAMAEGIALARAAYEGLVGRVQGVHVVAPGAGVATALAFLDALSG